MSGLDWPDNHHFDAAGGWLALGNKAEAWAELHCLRPSSRARPEVLAFEWQLLAADLRWAEAARVAEARVDGEPEEPEAWIQRSYALHELRQTREAWDKLLPAATLFPHVSTIAYNLACYACQLGDMDAARRWLRRSFLTGSEADRKIRQQAALKDQDLQPLWNELRDGRLG